LKKIYQCKVCKEYALEEYMNDIQDPDKPKIICDNCVVKVLKPKDKENAV